MDLKGGKGGPIFPAERTMGDLGGRPLRKRTIVIGGAFVVVGVCLCGAGVLVGVLPLAFGALLALFGMLPETSTACPRCNHELAQGTRRCPHCGNEIARTPRSPFESAGLTLRGKPHR